LEEKIIESPLNSSEYVLIQTDNLKEESKEEHNKEPILDFRPPKFENYDQKVILMKKIKEGKF
jgi:hypothetical protein